jgi:uncharacterized membrane protein affecting hemolysin expression
MMEKDVSYLGSEILFRADNYILHIAIVSIAIGLILTLIYELRKPKKDPNEDPNTKRINEILKD